MTNAVTSLPVAGLSSPLTANNCELPRSGAPRASGKKQEKVPKRNRKLKRRRFCCLLFYLVALWVFAVLGALVFWALEANDSIMFRNTFVHRCEREANELQDLFEETMRVDETDGNITVESVITDFNNSFEQLLECMRFSTHEYFNDGPQVFDFKRSMIFAVTVFTTVGYGDIVTRTVWGRLFTMFYAFFGIPLYYAFITDFGAVLGNSIVYLARKFRNFVLHIVKARRDADAASREHLSSWYRFLVVSTFLAIFVAITSALALCVEQWMGKEWDYLTAIHFVFSTITLIGFGDVLASHDLYLVVHLPFLVVGQTLCALSFYFIQRSIRFELPRLLTFCCLCAHSRFRSGNCKEREPILSERDTTQDTDMARNLEGEGMLSVRMNSDIKTSHSPHIMRDPIPPSGNPKPPPTDPVPATPVPGAKGGGGRTPVPGSKGASADALKMPPSSSMQQASTSAQLPPPPQKSGVHGHLHRLTPCVPNEMEEHSTTISVFRSRSPPTPANTTEGVTTPGKR